MNHPLNEKYTTILDAIDAWEAPTPAQIELRSKGQTPVVDAQQFSAFQRAAYTATLKLLLQEDTAIDTHTIRSRIEQCISAIALLPLEYPQLHEPQERDSRHLVRA